MLVTVQNTTGIGTEVTAYIVSMSDFHQLMTLKTLETAVNHRRRTNLIHKHHLISLRKQKILPVPLLRYLLS